MGHKPLTFSLTGKKCLKLSSQAGLEVLRLVNEPTAAALAYRMDIVVANEGPKDVVVFDFGGSSLDVTVIRVDGGMFEILAMSSDALVWGRSL